LAVIESRRAAARQRNLQRREAIEIFFGSGEVDALLPNGIDAPIRIDQALRFDWIDVSRSLEEENRAVPRAFDRFHVIVRERVDAIEMRRRQPIAIDETGHAHERFAATAAGDVERDEKLAVANAAFTREKGAGAGREKQSIRGRFATLRHAVGIRGQNRFEDDVIPSASDGSGWAGERIVFIAPATRPRPSLTLGVTDALQLANDLARRAVGERERIRFG